MNALVITPDIKVKQHRKYIYEGDITDCSNYTRLLSKWYPTLKVETCPIIDSTGLILEDTEKVLSLENDKTFTDFFQDKCEKARRKGKTDKSFDTRIDYLKRMLLTFWDLPAYYYYPQSLYFPIINYFLQCYIYEYEKDQVIDSYLIEDSLYSKLLKLEENNEGQSLNPDIDCLQYLSICNNKHSELAPRVYARFEWDTSPKETEYLYEYFYTQWQKKFTKEYDLLRQELGDAIASVVQLDTYSPGRFDWPYVINCSWEVDKFTFNHLNLVSSILDNKIKTLLANRSK